eukprot:6481220-Amphidinium_carterae.1
MDENDLVECEALDMTDPSLRNRHHAFSHYKIRSRVTGKVPNLPRRSVDSRVDEPACTALGARVHLDFMILRKDGLEVDSDRCVL